jgi:hypothetical protein
VRFNTFIQVFNFGFVSAGEFWQLVANLRIRKHEKLLSRICLSITLTKKKTTLLPLFPSSLLSFQSANENDQSATYQFNQGFSHLFMFTPINLFSYRINQVSQW